MLTPKNASSLPLAFWRAEKGERSKWWADYDDSTRCLSCVCVYTLCIVWQILGNVLLPQQLLLLVGELYFVVYSFHVHGLTLFCTIRCHLMLDNSLNDSNSNNLFLVAI